MKLSDIKGERTFDVIAELIDPVANIAEDPDAAALFARGGKPEGMDAKAYLIERLRKSVPKLLKSHKADLIAILSTIADESAAEYTKSLTLAKLISDVFELLSDDMFTNFFTPAATGSGSGAALANTEAQLA